MARACALRWSFTTRHYWRENKGQNILWSGRKKYICWVILCHQACVSCTGCHTLAHPVQVVHHHALCAHRQMSSVSCRLCPDRRQQFVAFRSTISHLFTFRDTAATHEVRRASVFIRRSCRVELTTSWYPRRNRLSSFQETFKDTLF